MKPAIKPLLTTVCLSLNLFSNNHQNDTTINNNHDNSVCKHIELVIGNQDKENKSNIYQVFISPSCMHCLQFLTEDIENFTKNNDNCVSIKFILNGTKDFFILKLMNNYAKTQQDYDKAFKNAFINYSKFVIAKFDNTKISEKIKKLLPNIKDEEILKYATLAQDFKFSDEDIKLATEFRYNNNEKHKKNTDEDDIFERILISHYTENVELIESKSESKEIVLPIIIKNKKIVDRL